MIERDGTFLHIDFGHMLGNFKKFKVILVNQQAVKQLDD